MVTILFPKAPRQVHDLACPSLRLESPVAIDCALGKAGVWVVAAAALSVPREEEPRGILISFQFPADTQSRACVLAYDPDVRLHLVLQVEFVLAPWHELERR